MIRLLIVADDWEALEVYETKLAPHFEVSAAPFGSEGIRMARNLRPDRILIDLTLDEMHAAEACEKLRAQPETSAIPLTVVLNEGEAPLGQTGVFPKKGDQRIHRPFDFASLIQELKA